MNCNLKRIKGTKNAGKFYACANPGCGRVIKIERAKVKDLAFPCAATEASDVVPDELVAHVLQLAVSPLVSRPVAGPGTELRKLLAEMDVTTKAKGCNCAALEFQMNQLGAVGCREQLDTLAAEVVKSAGKQKVEITPEMARFAIEEAIRRAELAASAKPDAPAAARRDAEALSVK